MVAPHSVMIQEPSKYYYYLEFQGQKMPLISDNSSFLSTLSTNSIKKHQNSSNYFKKSTFKRSTHLRKQGVRYTGTPQRTLVANSGQYGDKIYKTTNFKEKYSSQGLKPVWLEGTCNERCIYRSNVILYLSLMVQKQMYCVRVTTKKPCVLSQGFIHRRPPGQISLGYMLNFDIQV